MEEKLSDTNYIIHTPDSRHQSSMRHVNMLKLYHARAPNPEASNVLLVLAIVSVSTVFSVESGRE